MISCSHPTASLVPLSVYVKELEDLYGPGYLSDTFVADVRQCKWAFMIVDPFDRSYNPGKLIQANTPLAERTREIMEATLECLEREGRLLLQMPDEEEY